IIDPFDIHLEQSVHILLLGTFNIPYVGNARIVDQNIDLGAFGDFPDYLLYLLLIGYITNMQIGPAPGGFYFFLGFPSIFPIKFQYMDFGALTGEFFGYGLAYTTGTTGNQSGFSF